MADWNPDLYLKFQMERDRPALDLIRSIDMDEPRRIVDLGCGPGNSTGLLMARWPEAEIIGIDSSPSMIGKAQVACPGASFLTTDMCADLRHLGAFDIVFANASLQWVSDQARLMPCLFEMVGPKGVFAAQIPQYDQMPISKAIGKLVASTRWSALLGDVDPGYHFNPDKSYYDWCSGPGIDVRMWSTEYYHVMEGHDKIIEMMMSTGLKTYLEHIGGDDAQEFISSIRERLMSVYPLQGDGMVLFPFKRLFVVAKRS